MFLICSIKYLLVSMQEVKNKEENWIKVSKRDHQKDSANKYKASN